MHLAKQLLSAVFAALLLGPFGSAAAQSARDERPNIVFLLVDNFGFGDLGVYGGGALRGAPTPRIDALAAQGVRLTNFNVEPECTPTRAALMTGRMPIRSGASAVEVLGRRDGIAPWEGLSRGCEAGDPRSPCTERSRGAPAHRHHLAQRSEAHEAQHTQLPLLLNSALSCIPSSQRRADLLMVSCIAALMW